MFDSLVSKVKFYYNFAVEYTRIKVREMLVSALDLHSFYHRDNLHINYIHQNTFYQVVVPNTKRMCPFKKVETHIESNDTYKDVTHEIRKKSGPHYDFHKIPTTPLMLGYENLIFYKRNGDKIKYSGCSNLTI